MSDEEQIRTLIHRWAEAVHEGDLAGVTAGHTQDVVMFDVPPPDDGVRGMAAYRSTWPPFFEWQSSGATFDVVELDVVADADVGYAYALLRCGTAEDNARHPDRRLRLTLGLQRREGAWQIQHEHHSFPI